MKLEEIEAMLGKITPLPWLDTKVVNVNGVCGLSEYRINNPEIGVDIARCGDDYTFSKADSVFIAAAPTIIKELVGHVRNLEEENERLRRSLKMCSPALEKHTKGPTHMEII